MSFSHDSIGGEPELLCDINTTPLIDVMLVLLIMLIITIPIQLHAIDLATPAGRAAIEPVMPVRIDIDAASRIRWQGVELADAAALESRLRELAAQQPSPELQLRPDARARYAVVVEVLAATRRHGLRQVAMLGDEQFD